jgi:hypothetical protein
MNAIDQIDQIKSEARLELIKKACKRLKGKTKPSFSTVMHKLAEKEESFSYLDQSCQAVESFESSDLASENMSEIFG